MNRGSQELYRGQFYIVRESRNAILLRYYTDDEDCAEWVPLSQVEEIHRPPIGPAEIVMKAWVAKDRGWI